LAPRPESQEKGYSPSPGFVSVSLKVIPFMEVAVCSLRLIFQVGNNYIVEAVEFTGVHFRLIILPSITSSLSLLRI